jgi:hypothetical protein
MFKIAGTELPAPSIFEEDTEIGGGYNMTMGGGRRRNIKYKKFIWNATWSILSLTDSSFIQAQVDVNQPVSFVYDELGIDTMVFIDTNKRSFVPGTDFLSNLPITLSEA